MTPDEERELERLRARAYGPGGDIRLDPGALTRLRELERRRAGAGNDVARLRAANETITEPRAATAFRPLEAPAADDAEPTRVSPTHPSRRRLSSVLGILAALAIGLVVGALFGLHHSHSSSITPATRVIAQLSGDANFKAPAPFRGAGTAAGKPGDTEGFTEFHGLRAVLIPASGFTPGGGDCLVVYAPEYVTSSNSTTYTGPQWSGCAAGAFPATAQLTVTTGLPAATRSAFPGESLQFVYDKSDHKVDVFAAK